MFYYLLICWLGLNAGPSLDAKDAGRVLSLVRQMGGADWEARNGATKSLGKMMDEDRVSVRFLENVANQEAVDPATKKPYDVEVRRRCRELCKRGLLVTSDVEELPLPGIWHLHNDFRFPLSWKSAYSSRWPYVKWEYITKFKLNNGNWYAPIDVSFYYYKKARTDINSWNKQRTITNWRNSEVEKTATEMLVADLRRGGMPRREVERLLNRMVFWRTNLQYFGTFWPHDSRPPPHQ